MSGATKRTCCFCGTVFLWRGNAKGLFCSRECRAASRGKHIHQSIIEDNSIPEPNSGCWLWLRGVVNGYGTIMLDWKQWRAHRLSYVLYKGELTKDQPIVRHKCDNKLCVNPDHLEAGTPADNMREAGDRGLMRRGSDHYDAKLNEEQVSVIRSELARGVGGAQLARRYQVHKATIYRIAAGQGWRHVE